MNIGERDMGAPFTLATIFPATDDESTGKSPCRFSFYVGSADFTVEFTVNTGMYLRESYTDRQVTMQEPVAILRLHEHLSGDEDAEEIAARIAEDESGAETDLCFSRPCTVTSSKYDAQPLYDALTSEGLNALFDELGDLWRGNKEDT